MDGDPLNATGHRWYVVHTKPRQELLAAGLLESTHAVAVYLPQVRQPHVPARRWTTLFPGYLFLHADLRAAPASEIDKTPGVIRLVAFDGQPQPVPDGTIEALRRRVAELQERGGLPQHPFQPGDSVRFTNGPMAGLEGVFDGPMRPSQRVRVLMHFLGSLHAMEVDANDLEKTACDRRPRPARRTRGRGRTIHPHA